MRIPLGLLAVLMISCASAPPAPEQNMTRAKVRSERPTDAPCPLGVRDAQVVEEATANGVALTFVSASHVPQLRARVADAAGQYGPMAHKGSGHDARHGQGHQHGLRIAGMAEVTLEYTEVPGGARLHIVPTHGTDLERVRAKVHDRAAQMSSTACED